MTATQHEPDHDTTSTDSSDPGDARPRLKVTSVPATIRDVTDLINAGSALPDLYVRGGELVHLTQASGADGDTDSAPELPLDTVPLTPASLTRLLAQHAYVYKTSKDTGEQQETSPQKAALDAVLSETYWPDVRPLAGIVASPTLRRDGSLIQTAGYDPASGLYYAPTIDVPRLATPTPQEVADARSFILGRLLRDFPFVAPADKANFIGMLATPILRPYLRSRTPFGLISATTQSSGKTLLAEIIGHLYGEKRLVWGRGDEADLTKAITAALRSGSAQVMLWDNITEGFVVKAAVLAQLLTSATWSDRVLGSSSTFEASNDRLWMGTGNNIRLGGDMATRTVLIRLDPNDPHPDQRDQEQFGIPQLDRWLTVPANRAVLLRHLLVLVLDWIAAGAPRTDHSMRQFTVWAQGIGGLLDHHGIPDFLGNLEEMRDADDEDAEWVQFLAKWAEVHFDHPVTARQLRASADVEVVNNQHIDLWDGAFITDDRGTLPSAKSLGKWLMSQVGRWHGTYVIRSAIDRHSKVQVYRVEEADTATGG